MGCRPGWLLSLVLFTAAAAGAGAAPEPGERIYQQGILPDGTPLSGVRDGGARLEGSAAACTNCHRPSGLGGGEGDIRVPPIIGPYLFRNGDSNRADLELPHVPGFQPRAWAYTPETFAATLRTGHRPDGSDLASLMPRYGLDDAAVAALTDYLRGLSGTGVPGVSATDVDLATIVTPDADPVARDAMIDVLNAYVGVQREAVVARVHGARTAGEVEYRSARRWRLHIWTLSGLAETWARQLEQHFAAEPVFAVLSGIGGHTWAPVHHFCQVRRIPCLLPNIDLPPVAEQDFYNLYFSRGVLLEADLIASRVGTARRHNGRLIQVYRQGDVGVEAAAELSRRLSGSFSARAMRALPESASSGEHVPGLRRALVDARPDDTVVLWLRAKDLQALGSVPAPRAELYASGLMGGLENAPLVGGWRVRTQLAFPVDLPDLRRVRMNFPLAWLRQHSIPVRSLQVEVDTYLACNILEDTFGEMLDAYVPDYLMERLETMLSSRLSNGYYPRFGLAPGQRFASKGGYLVHLAPEPGKVTAPSEWLVP